MPAFETTSQKVVHSTARAHRAEEVVLELVPVAREAEVRHLRTRAALASVVVADKRLGELDRAVLAVVGVHHDVAVLHAGVVADDVARDVLVGHGRPVGRLAALVLRLDALLDRRGLLALAADDAVVRLARELPVLHAVHAVVAAHRGADRGAPDSGELGFEAGDVLQGRTRRRVAAVEERMNDDVEAGDVLQGRTRRRVAAVEERMNDDAPFGELLARTLHQLEEMLLVGVNSLVLEKPEEMER